MGAIAAQRAVFLIPTILGVNLVVFLMLHFTPGDPAITILGPLATHSQIVHLRDTMGLNRPLWQQFGLWLWNVLHLDFGHSYIRGVDVRPLVFARLQATLLLVGASLILSTLLGVGVGVLSAARRNSVVDRASMFLAFIALSIPDYWLGIMLILIFAVNFNLLPSGGMTAVGAGATPGQVFPHLVLPMLTLAAGTTAVTARVTRSSMLDVLTQDYIQAVRGRGANFVNLYYKHALRNALIPVITVVGIQAGFLLSGDILTEYIFSWPGLGALLLEAVQQRDFPVIQGSVFLIATLFVLINFVVDVTYLYVDRQIRHA